MTAERTSAMFSPAETLAVLRAIGAAAERGEAVLRAADAVATEGTVEPDRGELLDGLIRLLVARHPAIGIELLCDSGLASNLLPEVDALRFMPATGGRHKDVYRHTLLVVERTAPDSILRLGALFHDIGKPATKRIENGLVHFPGHAEVGAAMTRRRLRRLGADAALVEAVTLLVALHLRANSYEEDWTDSAVRRLDREAGDHLEGLLALSRADVTSGRREAVERALRRVDALEARIEAVRAADVRPVCPLSGHDLMAMFDRPAGPWIGVVKAHLDELVAAGELGADDAEAAREIAVGFMAKLEGRRFNTPP
jgi:poly(A) polymerase